MSERLYYRRIFKENKSDLRHSWTMLKQVICQKTDTNVRKEFIVSGIITDNNFHNCYTNDIIEFAKQIPHLDNKREDDLKELCNSFQMMPRDS